MERYNPSEIDKINLQFAFVLDNWQRFPDNRAAIEVMGSLIDQGYKMGSLQIAIRETELKKAEGSRAILPSDLKKLARKTGDLWVFSFKPNPAEGRLKIDVIPDYLRIKDSTYGDLVPGAFFEPRQIARIVIK